MDTPRTIRGLRSELSRVQAQVAELEATIRAIRDGEVDAFVVNSPGGSEIHTLHGPQEPYRILAEQMNEGAATLTAEGKILFCNRRLAEMAGRPAQLLLGSSIFSLLGEEERDLHPNLLSLACTKDVRIETRLMHPDRSPMAVQLSFSPIKIDGSDPMLCVVATDISELKQARRTLKQQAEIFDLAHDAITICDLDDRIFSWNRGAQDLYGWSEQEAIGARSRVLLHTALASADENVRELIASSSEWEGEYLQVARDGRALIVANRSSLLRDELGNPSAILEVNRDVTARKHAEAMAIANAEHLRLIIESVEGYALIMLDPAGQVISWNIGAERLKGYTAAEILGKHFSCFYLPAEAAGGHPDDELRLAAVNGRYAEEGWRVRKDGSRFLADVFISAIFDEQRKLLGFAKVVHDATERRSTERSLRQQALILDMATDAIFIRDGKDRITYWNQGAQRLYGWKKEEALSHVTHSLLQTKFPQPLADIEAQLLAEGHWEGELVHTRRDGSLLTMASSWTLQRDEANELLSVLEVNHDITSRTRAEDQLKTFAARLSLATHVLKAGIWEWHLNTDEVIWDATMREIYGLKRDCPVDYRLWLNTVVPEDRPGAETILQEVRAAKSEVSGGFRIVTPKGSLRYIHAAYGVILDELGQVASMIGVNIDVTERKLNELKVIQRSAQLEAANRELNVVVRRLGLATEALDAGIWDWDVRTNILEWDDRMFEIYGIPRNTRMDYTTWAGTVVAEDLPAVEVMLQKVIASRSQGSAEFRINLPNGTVRYIQAAEGTILDDAGEVVRVVGINIETTARRFNEDLEHLVDRRTAQLRAANKELEEFAYVASHDLKAPLRVIDNASKWLEEDLEEHLTDETREHLALLRNRVGRMEKLLDDLLDYARIGKATDNRYSETIAGNVLMGNVLALLDPGELTLSVSPRFADIQVCRMPLQQILMNLIGNAIKHHDKKKGHIEVAVEDNGDHYTFTVRDDGPGIPAQFHDQVFKMFQTLKPRDQVEGSGMGLALVRKNAELFGGVIQLESTEGEGSTFRLTWPKPQSLKKEAI